MFHKLPLSFAAVFLAAAAAAFQVSAQPLRTPVSASDPYGVDFSKIEGNAVQVTEFRGEKPDELTRYSLSIYSDRFIRSTTQYDEDGSVKLVTKYTYDDNHNLTSISGSDSGGGKRWTYQYKYNENGQQTEEKSLNSSNTTEWRTVIKYNSNGSPREQLTYNADDEITLKETFRYNDRGFVSADITQYPDGKLLKRTIYTYTKGGHVAQEDHYDSVGFYERIGYSYTEGGAITGFSNVGKDYTLNSRTTLEYGVNGRIFRQTITGKDKTVTDITYVYDWNNNWVMKFDGKIYTIREIIYGK